MGERTKSLSRRWKCFQASFCCCFSQLRMPFASLWRMRRLATCCSMRTSFLPGNMCNGEEAQVMSQSPGSLSSPGKARVETKESKVKLTWTKALEMEVTFANGTEEKIHMKGVSNLEGGKIPCLYTGSLDHDSDDSEVTVDGCKGDPQVLVEIASRKEVGGLLVLVIENEETYQLQPEKTHWNRNDTHKIQPKETQNLNFEASLPATRRSRLPREVTLKTWLVSDEG